ncbi:thiamine-phosphate kinase [Neorickettsia helminthoeca]|uniref:thiamine-phosphate kinase n=1 Tax=Neorickettsia helminthoeca TaxID=33994 RepID=UPI001E51F7F9|nr:thiamine-phosphate kinase [Neorickettsia helminthoeca]
MDEHEFLSKIISEIAEPSSLSNDAFVLEDLVITKDLLVEGIHFFPDARPFDLARKALRVNLSDLASMGSEPLGYFLGLALGEKNRSPEWLKEFADGLLSDQGHYSLKLFGGDTTMHSGPLVISITMVGRRSGRILTRSGAKIGDKVCLSGVIGDAYLGLLSYNGELEPNTYLRMKYDLPEPQIDVGKKIAPFATACIDISDGLLNDAEHIARNSNVMLIIYLENIPLSRSAKEILSDNPEMLREMVTGGDDYQLLFTVAKDSPLIHSFPVIGAVSSGKGIKVLGASKEEISFERLGFTHK